MLTASFEGQRLVVDLIDKDDAFSLARLETFHGVSTAKLLARTALKRVVLAEPLLLL